MRLTLLQLGVHTLTGVPVPGYLIETDDQRRILVDTGFAPPANEQGRAPYWFKVKQADNILSRLSALGLVPEDIDYLVCSHFDPDHCGNHGHFFRSECIVQRSHYQAVLAGHDQRFECTRSSWDLPELSYSQIDGDQQLVPGVELLASPGHVPGHQSVLVSLSRTGPVLLAIDAIPCAAQANPATWKAHPFDMDAEQAASSARRLMQVAAQRNASLVIFGHDAVQWQTLRCAPYFYD